MLRFLADENLKGDITRGLLRRQPDLDLVRVQDVGLIGADDRTIVAWAAAQVRIVLTHDRATMPAIAYERVTAGEPMSGVFIVPRRLAVRQAIDELLLLATCTEDAEWAGRVLHLPL
jgi:predicted nuclease of predicted toxin-antitoxin system